MFVIVNLQQMLFPYKMLEAYLQWSIEPTTKYKFRAATPSCCLTVYKKYLNKALLANFML